MTEDERLRLAEYSDATDRWPKSKPRRNRTMRVGQRSRKHQKGGRTSTTERKAIRYTTKSREW